METTLPSTDSKWINDFIFVVKFRMTKRIKNLRARQIEEDRINKRHSVRVVDQKGRFLLCECIHCGDRELAIDKIEAKGIYSRIECIAKGGE